MMIGAYRRHSFDRNYLRPRESEGGNFRPRFSKRARGFRKRGARGGDIVNKKDVCTSHLFNIRYGKCASHIF